MSDSKLLVILGVTGNQGGSVARVFQTEEPGWRIRGVTRNPDKPSNASLRASGIELVAGDLDDPTSLDRAFADADAIFSVTDFWQFLQPGSPVFAQAEKEGRRPNEIAFEKEVQQGKNIIDAAARAHSRRPLHRFVLSILSDSTKWSKGAIKWNLHFDAKARYVDYLKVEYPDLATRASYLQMGFYLSNWKTFPSSKPRKKADGSFVLPTTAVENGKPIPYVDPPNDTGHFVHALISSKSAPPGTNMLGFCELTVTEEYAKLWQEVLDKKARIEYTKYEDGVKAGLPSWLASEVFESGTYVTTYGWAGGDPDVVYPKDAGVDVSKLTNLAEWMKRQDWSDI